MVDPDEIKATEEAAHRQVQDVKDALKDGGYIIGPNQTKFRIKPLLEARGRMHRSQYDFYTNEDRTKALLKHPEPGYHYHWARHPQYDPMTGMRVAMGLYKYVAPSEIKSDAAAMFASHKGTTGGMVASGTLVLVKESHEAYLETHMAPQVEALSSLARVEEGFRGDIDEQSKGRAQATVERVEEQEAISPPDKDK